MEPLRHATSTPPPRPVLELVAPPVKPVQTRRIRHPRPWRGLLAGLTVFLLIVVPMALHAIWGVTGSAVLTDSMEPVVKAGDLIVTRTVDGAELEPGQIAVLEIPGSSLRAHRIVDIATGGGSTLDVTTKGDANPAADAPVQVATNQRVPVVLFRIPALGYVAEFFMRPAVLATGLGLLLFANVLTVVLLLYPRSTGERGLGKGGGA